MSATTSMPDSTNVPKAKEPRTPATVAETGSPQSLGQELLAIEQALKDNSVGDCFMNTWDGDKRSHWRQFVATATGLAQHDVSPPLAVQPPAAVEAAAASEAQVCCSQSSNSLLEFDCLSHATHHRMGLDFTQQR